MRPDFECDKQPAAPDNSVIFMRSKLYRDYPKNKVDVERGL